MTPEVKERIEQIRHGNVPEGYKKGKLGIVPVDWEEVPFSTLFTSTSDYTDDLAQYPLYSLTIEDGITAKTERYERSHLVKKENSYKIVRPNDYAYNPMNIRFGAVARHKGNNAVAVSGYYDIFTTVHESDLAFMDSFLTWRPMITYYNKVSTGSLVEKQRVHFSDFMGFSIALPPIEERRTIAKILTTQDDIIEQKERRLFEKQQQKKCLMQQLLTGKKRISGFEECWRKASFGKVFDFWPTNTLSRDSMSENSGTIGNIHYGDILITYREVLNASAEKIPNIKPGCEPNSMTYLNNGDVIIADTAEDLTAGKAVEIQNVGKKRIVSGLHTMLCRPSKGLFASGWLGYYLNSSAYHGQLRSLICGVKVCSISKKEIVKTIIEIPSVAEQKAIVQRISMADKELELLCQDLEQEKRKKKALMQLLLTGIVRVNA